ncbi:MAG: sulfatase [Planctomycetota bacterium]
MAEPYHATVARVEDLKLLLSSRLALNRLEVGSEVTHTPGQFEVISQRVRTTSHTHGAVLVVLAGSGLDARAAAVDFRNLRVRELTLRAALEPAIERGDVAALTQDCAIAGEQRPALLLPAGASVAFDVELRAGGAWLELGLGIAETSDRDANDAPLTLRVEVGDAAGASVSVARTLRPRAANADALWNDVALDLATLRPGPASVRLRAEANAPTDDVAAFAAPLLAAPADQRRPSLILISLDTLRADRADGSSGRDLMPGLRAFAERHVRFQQAYSAAPFTLPSHATIMSGQPPSVHGVERPGTGLNPQRSALLAEILAQAGYQTAAFTGGGYISYDFGFARGFDRYSIVDPMRDLGDKLRDTVPRAGDRAFNDFAYRERGLAHVLAWVDARRGQPFFLFLHTYLAHDYSAPSDLVREMEAGCTSRLGPSFEPFDADVRCARGESLEQTGTWLAAEDVRHMRNYYDATVRAMDQQLDFFLGELERRGLLANSIVVITADHGEEFWEHKGLYHGKTLYDEIVHVPLVFAVPARSQPQVVDDPVSLVDLAPTLLDLLGLPPERRMLGAPLAALARAPAAADSVVFAEVDCQNQAQRSMLRSRAYKLIANGDPHKQLDCFRDRYADGDELFDLGADPTEQHNLATQRPDLLRVMRARLDGQREALRAVRDQLSGDTTRDMAPETIEMLKKLGYLGNH